MSKLKRRDVALSEVIGFNGEDLEANRAGYLSKRQRANLRRIRRSWHDLTTITVIACGFVSTIAILDGMRVGDPIGRRSSVVGLICIVTAIVFAVCYYKWQQYQRDLWKGDVAVIVGNVSVSQHQESYGTKYTIRICRKTFVVDEHAFNAFWDRERCAIYYSPHAGKVLSAEATPALKVKKSI